MPSIIYGMLGLAIFVRALERYTSGAFLGMTGTNGRTIISAVLTIALLMRLRWLNYLSDCLESRPSACQCGLLSSPRYIRKGLRRHIASVPHTMMPGSGD